MVRSPERSISRRSRSKRKGVAAASSLEPLRNQTVSPEECVKQGNLQEGLAQLQSRVRAAPQSAPDRIFLFQLLSLLGQWGRAKTQLTVAGELDASLLLTVNGYSAALDSEEVRACVFRGERPPVLIGEPPEWVGPLLEALRLTSLGHFAQAEELRAVAFEAAPAIPGAANGKPFEWIADADPRLGPCLEMVLEGRYCWVPLANVRQIRTQPPAHLRDLVWMPAQIQFTNGGAAPVFIPTRYPGTEFSADNQCRLSRATEWLAPAAGVSLGIGQRLFATNDVDVGLCDLRSLVLGDAADDDLAMERGDG